MIGKPDPGCEGHVPAYFARRLETELQQAKAALEKLRRAAKAYSDSVLLFGIARAEYDAVRTDENAQRVSEASCRQCDAMEALDAALAARKDEP